MLRDAGIQLHASQSSVIVPPTQLTAGSQLASDIPAMYPHCIRQFSEDFESSLLVNWHLCTAGQIYDILSSPHMMCGRAQSMAYPMKFAIGILTSELACFCPTDSKALKDMTSKSIKNGSVLRTAFENCCSGTGVLESLKRSLTKYTQNKANVVKWKPGIVPEENPNLLDQLRLASIMIDPRFDSFFLFIYYFMCSSHVCRCMELFGRMANPSQDKIALEFPELRIQAVKQQLLQLLTDSFFNDFNFSPLHQPDVSAWYPGSNYDVSRPFERRTWIWIAQKLQFIKTGMTTLLSNFSASGNLSNDADDHTRDLKFFQVCDV